MCVACPARPLEDCPSVDESNPGAAAFCIMSCSPPPVCNGADGSLYKQTENIKIGFHRAFTEAGCNEQLANEENEREYKLECKDDKGNSAEYLAYANGYLTDCALSCESQWADTLPVGKSLQ